MKHFHEMSGLGVINDADDLKRAYKTERTTPPSTRMVVPVM